MRKPLVLVAAMALLANSEGSPQQFDLVCKGTYFDGPEKVAEPVERRLRVDLAGEKFCFDDCELVRDIHAVQPDRVEFIKNVVPRRSVATATVSRKTGEYEQLILDAAYSLRMEWKLQCDPAPFSGFPKVRF